jgi:hypothetical protein
MISTLVHLLRLFPFLCGGHRQLALENLALRQQRDCLASAQPSTDLLRCWARRTTKDRPPGEWDAILAKGGEGHLRKSPTPSTRRLHATTGTSGYRPEVPVIIGGPSRTRTLAPLIKSRIQKRTQKHRSRRRRPDHSQPQGRRRQRVTRTGPRGKRHQAVMFVFYHGADRFGAPTGPRREHRRYFPLRRRAIKLKSTYQSHFLIRSSSPSAHARATA